MIGVIDISKHTFLNEVCFPTGDLFVLGKDEISDTYYMFNESRLLKGEEEEIILPRFEVSITYDDFISCENARIDLTEKIEKVSEKMINAGCKYIYQIIYLHPVVLNDHVSLTEISLFGTYSPFDMEDLGYDKNRHKSVDSNINIYGFTNK